MTAFDFFEVLRRFGADVLLLAFGVTLVTSLVKRALPKRVSGKAGVFLPFLFGILFYAAYRMIATGGFAPLTSGILSTLEGGFGCGSAATIYYVLYEQFFRGKTCSPLAPLLEGIVEEERMEEAANALLEGSKGVDGEELPAFAAETLAPFALPGLPQEELALAALFVGNYLKALRTG